jgi:SAM-dependent methyltransferase
MTNTRPAPAPYTGVDNLEVMEEAQNYNRFLLDLIARHSTGGRVLDFGAGNGTFARPCRERGMDVTALEPDARLQTLLQEAGVPAVADVAALPDAAFDYAYSLNVLEHIGDDVGALRGLLAKLRPGGRLLVYVPAFPVLYTSMDAKVGHVRRYTLGTLSANVRAAGFLVHDVRYADSLGFLATLVFKGLDNGRGDVNRPLLRLYDRLVFPLSRAVDAFTHRWFGKNLVLVASRPEQGVAAL